MKFWRLLSFFLSVVVLRSAGYSQENNFYSQCGQDKFLYEKFFKNKTNGVFVDIGAHDGITFSNTFFFKKHLGWKGLCVEPMPDIFAQLAKNRSCICIEACIYDKSDTAKFLRVHSTSFWTEMLSGIVDTYDPKHLQRIALEISNGKGFCEEITVHCYPLNTLLSLHNFDHVDYLSLDTEGGELDILKSIDFEKFTIDVIDVENNYKDPEFERFLKSKGYQKLAGNPCPFDEMYVRSAWYATLS